MDAGIDSFYVRVPSAIREFKNHTHDATKEIREVLNLVVDAYCFRANDIRSMDFFKLKLERLMASLKTRHSRMDALLDECWWEELIGAGCFLRSNKTVSKQFVKLVGTLLSNLDAMIFAVELETCHWTHTALMKDLQRRIHVLQAETNDLIEVIAEHVLSASTHLPEPQFTHLESSLERLIKKYTAAYSVLLSDRIRTTHDISTSMPLNVFLFSFHALVQTLFQFEQSFNRKDFTTRHRVAGFTRRVLKSFWKPDQYSRRLIIYALRTTFAVCIGVCLSTFIFAFSPTIPNAIAMVARMHIGGTHSSLVNRLSGLVAGTVLPSIITFFTCKVASTGVYYLLNNSFLFVWVTAGMYVFYSSSYVPRAGVVSSYMAASVVLEHSCRSQNGNKSLSYSSLTENSLGILILMLTEALIQPQSARKLLRANIKNSLQRFQTSLTKVYRHHLAQERGNDSTETDPGDNVSDELTRQTGLDDILDAAAIKELQSVLDVDLPRLLADQEKLLQDASSEPDLWRPVFSRDKYSRVLAICRTLLTQLRILADLVTWHHGRRRSTVSFHLPPTDNDGGEAPPDNTYNDTTLQLWRQAQDTFAAALSETLNTLISLYDDQVPAKDADDTVIFLQMKEAFRIADVHRRGEVDATELASLLEQLLPYSANRGAVHMEQYVAEFMKLVDRNGDGKISYAEFMEALNHGFRLELEIYETRRGSIAAHHQMSQESGSDMDDDADTVYRDQANVIDTDAHDTRAALLTTASSQPAPSPTALISRLWPPALLPSEAARSSLVHPIAKRSMPARPTTQQLLLNVEAFSIKEAARLMRQRYGDHLLAETTARRRVAVEDFVLMSCLVCAVDEIATQLVTLHKLEVT
ncbi:hypothetical protein PINS_up017199 [Pythium insidiosum]|nr:hypothetical protein PINS_up017199 [Pythium insidiosum]